MELAMIGLGRMGGNMTVRLVGGGHRVVAYDLNASAVDRAVAGGAVKADSLEAAVKLLKPPRVLWIMLPAGKIVDETLDRLAALLKPNDVVIDGGNSYYKDTVRRAGTLGGKGIQYVDVGTSGGIWGIDEGYCLMIGGDAAAVDLLRPIFETLAPAADQGWARVGPAGAGHFVKMVHNGIEYGLMQAYAEGFAILERRDDLVQDLAAIAKLWGNGSVIRSWLLELTAAGLAENPKLEGIRPYVADSGEGRWTVTEAIEQNVAAPVITQSLLERLRSRDDEAFADRLLAVMRNKFGGHDVKKQ
jgi:6-phosphogluconate dehydrogenase